VAGVASVAGMAGVDVAVLAAQPEAGTGPQVLMFLPLLQIVT
jgi:hypothetical protein